MTEPAAAVAPTRARLRRRGVLSGLAGHAIAVAVAFGVAKLPTWSDLEGLAAGAAMFVILEVIVLINGIATVSRRRTRDVGIGFFYGWLGAWLVLLVGITVNNLRYR